MSTINSIIQYKGVVDLKLNVRGKTLNITSHNEGTNILFESICRFLSGQYRGVCDIPCYLDIRQHESTQSILSSKIDIGSRIYNNDINGYYVLCECVVPYNSISITIDTLSTYDLVLCAEPDPNVIDGVIRPLAKLAISGADLGYIAAGTSAIIQWKLYVMNGGN